MAGLNNLMRYPTYSRIGSELLRWEASYLDAGRGSSDRILLPFCLLRQIDLRTWLACRQRIHPGEAEIAGVVAPIGPFFLACQYRKG